VLSAELKAFYMVARLGSITQAAKKLGLSQPTVTTQIRNLESQYSVELFYRGGRRLSVSEEGARLLPMVKVLMQQEADIEFFLRNCGQVQGTLRIAATAPYYILDLVKTFQLAGKRVILANLSELNAALLEAIGANRYAILVRRRSS